MILKGAENGKHTGMISIDLRKDFDTLNHKILISRNEIHRFFLDKTIKSFHSYLTSRYFSVSLPAVLLEEGTIDCGVPKGRMSGSEVSQEDQYKVTILVLTKWFSKSKFTSVPV